MVSQISVKDARKNLINKEALFVDIRREEDFLHSHIPGAISLNPSNIDRFIETTDKLKTVICYCYHGISSIRASEYFLENGFKSVYSLSGGFEAWENDKSSKNV